MSRSIIHRIATAAAATSAVLAAAAPVGATAPTVEQWTNHVEVSWFECDGFAVAAEWDIHHRLTFYYDGEGVAIRDIERVDYAGRLSNPETGAWVPDGGTKIFFDTLAPDGSFLDTTMVQVRKSDYIFVAGRTDFGSGDSTGINKMSDASIAALCDALDG